MKDKTEGLLVSEKGGENSDGDGNRNETEISFRELTKPTKEVRNNMSGDVRVDCLWKVEKYQLTDFKGLILILVGS